MSVPMPTLDAATSESATRWMSREVPNMRNPQVAADYKRQRDVLDAALERQRDEMKFWESVQADEGWV